MRNLFKLQIILLISFIILFPLNLKAQKEYIPKEAIKNQPENSIQMDKNIYKRMRFIANHEDRAQRMRQRIIFNHSQIKENYSDQMKILFKKIPLTINKIQLTLDVVDSIIYTKGEDKFKESFTYGNKANILTYSYEYWDGDAGQWINDWRDTYTYNGSGNQLTYLAEDWAHDAGIWVNIWRYTFTYDDSGNILTCSYESWDGDAGMWINGTRYTYIYDGSGNLIHFTSQAWFGSDWYAINGRCTFNNNGNDYSYRCQELYAYYSTMTSIDHLKSNTIYRFSLSQNYPNFFNPTTVISWQLPVSSYVELYIYNTLGQKISTLVSQKQSAGKHRVEWNSEGLSSGLYYYRITAGEYSAVKKMLLIK